jgi:predicted Zn-dependent peptidase
MVLFDALLAGGKGFRFTRDYPAPATTLLGEALAKAGIRAETETDWQASREPYVFTAAADLDDAGQLAGAEAALASVVETAAARAWSEGELQAARRQVLTGWAADLDDLAGRAHQLAFFEALGGHERLLEMPSRIAAVTVGDLRRFAARWLTRQRVTAGWFVPTRATPPPRAASALPVAAPSSSPSVSPPVAGSPPAAPAGGASRVRLGNGGHLDLEPVAGAGLVSLRGRIDAGSIYDGPASGLSALATELLASAPVDAGAPGLTWTLHEEPTASASLRWIEFTGSCLSDEAPALLRSVAARLRRAADAARAGLSDHEWTELVEATRSRARSAAGDAAADLWRTALASLRSGDGAAAAPPWGSERPAETPAREGLRAFLASHVTWPRTRLWLAGGVQPMTRASLDERLGTARGSGAGPAPPAAPAARGPAAWTERRLTWPGKTQDEIAVVWAGDRTRAWDPPATQLLLYLLGETGYAGRLGRALVEPGLAYSVYATLEEPAGVPGFLMVRTAAATGDSAEALRRIRAVLEGMARGEVEDADLQEAKAYLRGKQARGADGGVAAAGAAADRAEHPARFAFESVTLEQLRDTARRLAARGSPLALVAGP